MKYSHFQFKKGEIGTLFLVGGVLFLSIGSVLGLVQLKQKQTSTSNAATKKKAFTIQQLFPTIPLISPGVATPTQSQPNQPGNTLPARIESIRPFPTANNFTKIGDSTYRAQYAINFCESTTIIGGTGNTQLKFWIEDLPNSSIKYVKSSTTASWNYPSPLS